QSVAHGSSVTAYQSSTVPYGSSCTGGSQSQTRTCNNGTLSGSYQYASCSVAQPEPPSSLILTPSSSVVRRGESIVLTWSSSAADSCTVTGGGQTWTGTASPAGGQATGPIFGEVTYTFSCQNGGGTSAA